MKNLAVNYAVKTASQHDICSHLSLCDVSFIPPLSEQVDIPEYSKKIYDKAITFEAWQSTALIGLVAAYFNDLKGTAGFITNVSVASEYKYKGIATELMSSCLSYARNSGFKNINLEVLSSNVQAIRLYKKFGFKETETRGNKVLMSLNILNRSDKEVSMRDYNKEYQDNETRQYAYGFDFDVMHPYMIKSFAPFFNKGSLLELGSFKGNFTRRLLPYFNDITCVEASDAAIEEAKHNLGAGVKFINTTFEKAILPMQYDNIVLTHVLEHLDDPVLVLRRINDEWLAENGRFFLVCPNANAPSRQIAVKMGMISHNSAVTPAEAEHGHRRTYALDTLERDAVSAGLEVVYRSGIFFKALANSQWDRLLQTDIISKDYLEGCYKFGQLYPDLCSSIFLICKKGEKND